MLLAINVNNTNIKFGVIDGEEIVGEWRQHTSAMRTGDEHAVWLTQLMQIEGIDPKSITDAIIGSVVPNANFNLRRLCTRYFNTEPMFINDPGVDPGIKIKGVGAGADRVCNSVGASILFPKTPVVVVDFGTATNFDVVDKSGNYCGGVIAPGPNLALQALEMAAAQLPHVAMVRPPSVVGRATVPAMQSGVFWGYVGLLEGIVRRIREERREKMGVVATGGLAPLFAASTDVIEKVDPDLTLWGLRLIYRHNTNR
jgi:type III pantothenate kinase